MQLGDEVSKKNSDFSVAETYMKAMEPQKYFHSLTKARHSTTYATTAIRSELYAEHVMLFRSFFYRYSLALHSQPLHLV